MIYVKQTLVVSIIVDKKYKYKVNVENKSVLSATE